MNQISNIKKECTHVYVRVEREKEIERARELHFKSIKYFQKQTRFEVEFDP